MPTPNIVFDFPIKRPYPWRFTTSLIFVASTIVLVGLIYFNLAAVGLTSKSFSSTTFVAPQDPSWIERMKIKTALNWNLGCDPTTLVSGASYRTQNGVLSYTVKSITMTSTSEELSTLVYGGSVLENCTISTMNAFADFAKLEAKAETRINCTLPGSILLIVGFDTGLYSEHMSSRGLVLPGSQLASVTHIARKSIELLGLFAKDVRTHFVSTYLALNDTSSLCTLSAEWVSIEGSITDVSCNGPIGENPDVETEAFQSILDNFIQVLWSAILLDLGVNSTYNRLTDTGRMHESLHSNLAFPNFTLDEVDLVLANTSGYGLPLEQSQPAPFNAGYLCRKMCWKTPTNLFVDVLVATVSLFMAYWALLNLALRCVATRSSPHGNHCVCPSCNELPQHASSTSEVHELRSLGSGSIYKSVPTRSQSTPP